MRRGKSRVHLLAREQREEQQAFGYPKAFPGRTVHRACGQGDQDCAQQHEDCRPEKETSGNTHTNPLTLGAVEAHSRCAILSEPLPNRPFACDCGIGKALVALAVQSKSDQR